VGGGGVSFYGEPFVMRWSKAHIELLLERMQAEFDDALALAMRAGYGGA
jgi:hypothetical protein